MDEQKYKAAMVAELTKADGTVMARQANDWENLEYEDVVELEGVFVKFQEMLNQLGQQKAKEKQEKRGQKHQQSQTRKLGNKRRRHIGVTYLSRQRHFAGFVCRT